MLINSSRLGEAASGELRARGQIAMMPTAFDPAVAEALGRAIEQHGTLTRGTYIETNVPGSDLFTLRIVTSHHDLDIQQEVVGCYDYAVFHPNNQFVTVHMPINLISRLEFELVQPNFRRSATSPIPAFGARFTTKAFRFWKTPPTYACRFIAAIEGRAHVHSEYALLANVIVAAEGATFHDVPHFAGGIVPGDGIFTTWSYRAGAARAEAFLLNPEPVTARTAHE
jgi:hypothetical protein